MQTNKKSKGGNESFSIIAREMEWSEYEESCAKGKDEIFVDYECQVAPSLDYSSNAILPNELLILIFSYLSYKDNSWFSVLTACKLWNDLGNLVFSPAIKNNLAIRLAASYGQLQRLINLLNDPRIQEPDLHPVLLAACISNQVEVVKFLIRKKHVSPSFEDNKPIREACRMNASEVVMELLNDSRVDPSDEASDAFIHSCQKRNIPLLKILANDCRVDPFSRACEAFRDACRQGHLDVVQAFMELPREKWIIPSGFQEKKFVSVSLKNSEEVFDISPEACNPYGFWHNDYVKSKWGYGRVIGVNVCVDRLGPPSLWIELDAVPQLYKLPSSNIRDINRIGVATSPTLFNPGANQNEAISYAAANGHTMIVKILLSLEEVDPSARDNMPIRRACLFGHLEVVKMLLKHPKVNPAACNNEAIKAAIDRGHSKIVQELLKDKRVQLPTPQGLATGSNYDTFNVDMFESDDKYYQRFQKSISTI